MREIKFRGRDGDDWYYGSLFVNECGHTAISAPKSFWMKPVNAETVGQFTGLTDKDGNAIYEGDIVAWDDGTPPTSVRWDEHFAYYVIMESLILGHACKSIRVIGNVYDNPDLLEVAHD